MKTILYTSPFESISKHIMLTCLQYNLSFEFLNGNEFFFTIYDDDDYSKKRAILGEKIINYENIVK